MDLQQLILDFDDIISNSVVGGISIDTIYDIKDFNILDDETREII